MLFAPILELCGVAEGGREIVIICGGSDDGSDDDDDDCAFVSTGATCLCGSIAESRGTVKNASLICCERKM